jgi:hypothetical protein
MLKWTVCGAIVGAGAMLAGCGFTDLEMAAKQRQIDALVAEVHALKTTPAPACPTDAPRASRTASRPVLSSR